MTASVTPDDTPRTARIVAVRMSPQIEHRSVLATHSRTVLAMSGFVMLGFVVVHLLGNLLAFAGAETFNAYARSIQDLGTPFVGVSALLWVARSVLAGALALHLAAHLYIMRVPTTSGADEPGSDSAQYAAMPLWYATLPVEWLQATGALIALFVAFHIAQLTIGATHPAFIADDPDHNLVVALGFWPVSIAYIAAAVAVGAHLLPGLWTGMRSLGLIRHGTEALADTLSVVIPLVLVVGMSAVPLAIIIGVLR